MNVQPFQRRDDYRPLTIEEWGVIVFTTLIQIPVFRHGRHQPAVNDNPPTGRRA